MAKNDSNSVTPTVDAKVQEPVAAPIADLKEAMPLERKQEDHAAVLRDPNRALMPGKSISLNEGMLGEIEGEIVNAEKAGQSEVAAKLNSILMKFSALQQELKSCEQHVEIKAKAFYAKLKAHF